MGWLDVGAGSAQGLKDLLAQHEVEQQMQLRQQAMEEASRHNLAGEGLQGRAIDEAAATRRMTQQSLDEYRRQMLQDRNDASIEKAAGTRGIGDPVTEQEYAREQGAGLPSGNYNVTPGKAPTSTIGLMPLDRGQPSVTSTTAETGSPLAAPRSITYRGNSTQRTQAATADYHAQDLQRKMDDAAERANEAWQRLQQQGQTQEALNAFHDAQLELKRTQVEAASAKAASDQALKEAKTPQPQFFRDHKGQTHAVVFDKGSMKEIPLPAGYEPTKGTAPGIFERISGWFGGDSGGGSEDLGANWGK
jgi:hypothetical protein